MFFGLTGTADKKRPYMMFPDPDIEFGSFEFTTLAIVRSKDGAFGQWSWV
jgi:hypothetical protein